QPVFDAPAPAIVERVAHDLGDGGGDARLVLPVEARQLGDPARAAAHRDDVGLAFDRDGQETLPQPAPRATRMHASSRSRRMRANRMAAISAGWLAESPG